MATTPRKRTAAAEAPTEAQDDAQATTDPSSAPEPAQTCVNDSRPAAWVTTNPGQVPVYLCDDCANRIYPGRAGLKAVDAPAE